MQGDVHRRENSGVRVGRLCVAAAAGTLAFTTESSRTSLRDGARETYVIHGADEFEDIFELAEPGRRSSSIPAHA